VWFRIASDKRGKEVGLLRHNIKKCNTQLLSRKKTSVSNDKIYGFCSSDKTVENYKKKIGFYKY
jgi:hypothetical protein